MPDTTVRREKRQALIYCGIAVVIAILGFANPGVSTALAMLLAGVILLRIDVLGLPALAILWIQATDFLPPGSTRLLTVDDGMQQNAVYIGGLPLSLQLFVMLCMTLVIIATSFGWRLLFSGRLRMRFPPDLFLWLLFLVITVASAAWGRSLGQQNWTQPLRASMAIGAFFYGLLLFPALQSRLWIAQWLLRIVGIVLIFLASGLYWNHSAYFYVPLGGMIFWMARYRKRFLLSLLLGLATVAILLFSSADTLTILLLVLSSFAIGFLLFQKNQALRHLLMTIWTLLIFPFSLLLVVLALSGPPPPSGWNVNPEANFIERVQFKLYQDRGSLWRATWKLITTDPQLIAPAGRPLSFDHPITRSSEGYWYVHAHNAYLEMFRQTGIIGGIVFIWLVLALWWRSRNLLLKASALPPLIRAFGWAAMLTIAMVAAIGIAPFDFFAGPWLWLWLGMVTGMARRTITRPLPSTHPQPVSSTALSGQGLI